MLALFAVAVLFMPGLPGLPGSEPVGEVYAALPVGSAARRLALLGPAVPAMEAASNSSADDWGTHTHAGAVHGSNATATLVLEPVSHAASVALQHLQVGRGAPFLVVLCVL